jgi:hypothetical protein
MLPRVLHILEKSKDTDLKVKVLNTVHELFDKLDTETIKSQIVKSLEILRKIDSNGKICMMILEMYERCCKVLTVEEIGQKVLPGLIPILVTAHVSTEEFGKIISSIRNMLKEVESHRLDQLKNVENQPVEEETQQERKASNDLFGASNDDPFAFMNAIDPPK